MSWKNYLAAATVFLASCSSLDQRITPRASATRQVVIPVVKESDHPFPPKAYRMAQEFYGTLGVDIAFSEESSGTLAPFRIHELDQEELTDLLMDQFFSNGSLKKRDEVSPGWREVYDLLCRRSEEHAGEEQYRETLNSIVYANIGAYANASEGMIYLLNQHAYIDWQQNRARENFEHGMSQAKSELEGSTELLRQTREMLRAKGKDTAELDKLIGEASVAMDKLAQPVHSQVLDTPSIRSYAAMIAHEIGHMAGLQHPPLENGPEKNLMYPVTKGSDPSMDLDPAQQRQIREYFSQK